MHFKGFLGILSILLRFSLGFCGEGDLWFIEQDFVKFGKREVYETSKREILDNDSGIFSVFAAQEGDLLQYVYFIPIKNYCRLSDFMQSRIDNERSLSADVKIAYLSTLNFTIGSLHRFLSNCSYLPKGKGSIAAFSSMYYYLFGIVPGNEAIFETQLQKIANEQSQGQGICFRSWKVLIGSDIPKYFVVVFAATEKLAQRRAESLEFIPPSMKDLLRSQKQGPLLLRKDLCPNNLES
jgi:hypothetical protein